MRQFKFNYSIINYSYLTRTSFGFAKNMASKRKIWGVPFKATKGYPFLPTRMFISSPFVVASPDAGRPDRRDELPAPTCRDGDDATRGDTWQDLIRLQREIRLERSPPPRVARGNVWRWRDGRTAVTSTGRRQQDGWSWRKLATVPVRPAATVSSCDNLTSKAGLLRWKKETTMNGGSTV